MKKKQTKKLLVLGSDYGTLDTVLEAKKMGLYVIVTDTMTTSPTRDAADETWNISTTDIDALEAKCLECGISGVVYGASDFNITQGRALCKRLGLPHFCTSDFAWENARNKALFKKTCKSVGAPVATDYYLSDSLTEEELKKVKYPVVVKPVDMSGNRGMSYCNNEDQLVAAYKYAREVSDNPLIVVERQLFGAEYCIDYVMADGEIEFLYFVGEHNQPEYPQNYYSIMNTTSSDLKKYFETTDQKVREAIKAAGCREGIVWVEVILDQDGQFYILEMGHRYGGEMIYGLYEKVSGFNSHKYMIETALGVRHNQDSLPKILDHPQKEVVGGYFLFAKKCAVIADIKGLEEIEKLPGITIDMPKRIGSSTREGASAGIIHILGENIEDFCKKIETINLTLKILDASGENLFVIYDDYNTLRDEYHKGLKEFSL
ncbi:MAG: ATP-grasp domain-containing protein [Muribaculaceae bacterium]|nr:ATP-grasp domain-containing protein [Muribaculaceae bacterium]